MPCWWVLTRTKQLSMAATARVIWLCACVRYCRPRGWCLSVSLAFFVFRHETPDFVVEAQHKFSSKLSTLDFQYLGLSRLLNYVLAARNSMYDPDGCLPGSGTSFKIFQAYSVLRQNTIVCREVRADHVPSNKETCYCHWKIFFKCVWSVLSWICRLI